MKFFKWIIIIFFPLFLFIVIVGTVVGEKSSGSESGSVCEYTADVTTNEKLEIKREYVKGKVVDKNMVNAVLGVYAKDEYKDLDIVINKLNKAYVYVTEKGKNMSETSYIQSYVYGNEYLDFLIEKKENSSIRVNKEYQEKIGSTSEDDYRYYISVLSMVNSHCSTSTDGLPLNKPYTITGWFPNYNQDGTGDKHYGIDFGVSIGTDVFSVVDGEVVSSNNICPINDGYIGNECGKNQGFTGSGNFVFIKSVVDGNEYYIMYCHMKDISVKNGDVVFKGMKIGTSGNSGNSTGAHLHFEIHKNSKKVGSDDGIVNPCEFVEGLCE